MIDSAALLRSRTLAVLVVAVALVACDSGRSIAPRVPRTVEAASMTSVSGMAASMASPVPMVIVRDQDGRPLANVLVQWRVLAGGGQVANATSRTNATGVATSGGWTLGASGGQQLEARVEGVGTVVFVAAVASSGPTAIQIVSGNNQLGTAGAPLSSVLTVRVVNQAGTPVPGVPLTITPGPGSGSVSPLSVTTDSQGRASFAWTLGSAAVQSLIVTSSAMPGVSVTFTARVADAFSIVVRYIEFTPNARQQLAIDRAVEKFTSILLATTGTSQVTLPAGACGREWMPAVSEVVTNLIVFARVGVIDGTPPGGNNIIGNANVCVLHPSSGLPAVGTLLLDSEDLAALETAQLLDPLVLHEVGHTVGIGTLWPRFVTGSDTDPYFTGPAANAQFLAVGGGAYQGNKVPVEAGVGEGSDRAHWRESVLGRELMTSRLTSGPNPLSVVTIGALQDIGYTVSYAPAEPFQLFASALGVTTPPAVVLDLRHDVHPAPPLPPGASVRDVREVRR